jgi:ketosteroid isomerase-like protein
MSEQEQNIELVKKGYEAFMAGQPGQSSVSGTYHGKGEIGEYISRLAEQSTTVNPHRFIADDDTVVVLSETTSGGETSQDADVFTLRDGKLVRAQVYGDTAMMERVFGKKQLAGSGAD